MRLAETVHDLAEQFVNDRGNLAREQGRDRISHLDVLLCARAGEEVIVGKGLESDRFAHRQAATLFWVIVNVIMPVFADMRSDRGAVPKAMLHAKAVREG